MKWYHRFRKIYTKNEVIKFIGTYLIATREERKIKRKYLFQVQKLKKHFNHINSDKFQYDFAIVAIIKNEAMYLVEWINYHLMQGVDLFLIYDHDSDDKTREILDFYIKKGLVKYKKISTPNSRLHHPQTEVYTDAIYKFKDKVKYMGFIDVDEFIVSENTQENVLATMVKLDEEIKFSEHGGLGINWLTYGSSFFKQKPEGLVIENYIYRAPDSYYANETIKSIVNPRLVISGGIHQPVFYKGYHLINELGKAIDKNSHITNSHQFIRINHYSSKSEEELEARIKKGFGGTNIIHKSHDINEIEDKIMYRYIEKLKKSIEN